VDTAIAYVQSLISEADKALVEHVAKPDWCPQTGQASAVTPADGKHFKLVAQAVQQVWKVGVREETASDGSMPVSMPGGPAGQCLWGSASLRLAGSAQVRGALLSPAQMPEVIKAYPASCVWGTGTWSDSLLATLRYGLQVGADVPMVVPFLMLGGTDSGHYANMSQGGVLRFDPYSVSQAAGASLLAS
jgi:hypothetical protein